MDYTYFDMIRSRRMPEVYDEVTGRFPADTPVGMAYVPYQTWEEPYETDAAFEAGTLFSSLDYPLGDGGAVK